MDKQELEEKIIHYRFHPIQKELFELFAQYEALCNAEADSLALSILHFYMGEAYFRLGNYEKTVFHMNKSLLVEKPADKKIFDASAYNILGLMFTFTGYEIIAVENYLSALAVSQKHQLHHQAAIIHINMGWLYRDLDNYERAMEYYDAALEELEEAGEKDYYNIKILCQAYRGQLFCKMGDYASALRIKDCIEELRTKNQLLFYDVCMENFYIRIYDYLQDTKMVQHYLSSFLEKVALPDDFLEFFEFYVDVCKFTMEKGMKEPTRLLLDALHKNAAALSLEFIQLQVQALEVQYQQKYSNYEEYLNACRIYMVIQQQYENALKKSKLISIDLLRSLNEVKKEKLHFEELSRRDSMTHLYNKSTIEFIIKDFLDHGTQEGAALVLMDIDYFKNINDSFGHLAGDQVISSVSALIEEHFHKNSSVGRFGGDEFLILIRTMDTQPLLIEKLEKLRMQISQICLPPDSTYPVTVSCGVLFLDESITCYEQSFSLVDHALYEAKSSGRNQIVIANKNREP